MNASSVETSRTAWTYSSSRGFLDTFVTPVVGKNERTQTVSGPTTTSTVVGQENQLRVVDSKLVSLRISFTLLTPTSRVAEPKPSGICSYVNIHCKGF